MQMNLYKYCGVDPITFWRYTPGETVLMISASVENISLEHETRNKLEARLCAVIMNANGVTKSGNKKFDVNDFMPDNKEQPVSPDELEQAALAATMKMGGEVRRS